MGTLVRSLLFSPAYSQSARKALRLARRTALRPAVSSRALRIAAEAFRVWVGPAYPLSPAQTLRQAVAPRYRGSRCDPVLEAGTTEARAIGQNWQFYLTPTARG